MPFLYLGELSNFCQCQGSQSSPKLNEERGRVGGKGGGGVGERGGFEAVQLQGCLRGGILSPLSLQDNENLGICDAILQAAYFVAGH